MPPDGRKLLPTLLVALTLTAVAPTFLVGAFAADIISDLDLDLPRIGLAGSAYTVGFGIGALATRRQRLAVRLSAALLTYAVIALAAAVLTAAAWGLAPLVGGSMLAGVASSAIQAIAAQIVAVSDTRNPGVVYGALQSAKPAAAVAVGAIGIAGPPSSGWRFAFIGVGAVGLAVAAGAAWLSRSPDGGADRAPEQAEGSSRWMWRPTLINALGLALTSITATFLVTSARHAGFSPVQASSLLLVCGVFSVGGRLAAGIAMDRIGVPVSRLLGALFALGAVGCFLVALDQPNLLVIGALLVYGPGWAFGGVLLAQVSMHDRHRAARSAGALFLGASIGGTLGPAGFGALIATGGIRLAWSALGAVIALASLLATTWRVDGAS